MIRYKRIFNNSIKKLPNNNYSKERIKFMIHLYQLNRLRIIEQNQNNNSKVMHSRSYKNGNLKEETQNQF